MTRLSVILGGAIVLAAAAIMLVGGHKFLTFTEALRRWGTEDTSGLPQVPLSEVLSTNLTTVDFLVFKDGPRGWYLVDDPALHNETEIGFYGRRFLGHLTNTEPAATYCEGDTDAKIIWAVRDARETAAMAYCNVSRMDFTPLLPYAQPVSLTDEEVTESTLNALRAEIAADPSRRFVDVPPAPLPFSHLRSLRPPMLWSQDPGANEAMTEAIAEAMEGAPHSLHIQNDRVNYASFYPEGSTDMVYGSFIQTDKGRAVLDGLYLYAPYIEVSCAPADCARLDGLDLAPIVAPWRPAASLSTALAAPVPLPNVSNGPGTSPRDPEQPNHGLLLPRPDDMADTATLIAETRAIKTRVRYIRLNDD
ncbi:hypothetical protein KUV47_06665 [Vannielia litorea]|uniref:hypothetical protein n=1 Tax=Vannielia litorea TaxID=1217970 RepID=UPI001C946FC6|nr:hypothetical protein [Vannielia litorea]MBY6152888.1 hypothetical protein [Vannielia litorea]